MKLTKKKKFTLFILSTLILILILLLYNAALVDGNKLTVKIEMLERYGKPEGNEEILGLITSFDIDKYQNIYIADDAFKVIKKFSKKGELIGNYGFGPGKGPGEFSAIHRICVDTLSNIYVLDKINLNLNVFDSLNNLLITFKLPFLPAQIIPVQPMIVDVMGFAFSYKGDLVYRYNLLKENSTEPEITYCERPAGENAEISLKSGNSGRLKKSSSGNIYYSFFHPYIIRKYSNNGNLLNVIQGKRDLSKPFADANYGRIESPAGLKGLVLLPDDILLILVYESFGNEIIQDFDFIDGKSGKFIGSVSCKELGLEQVRFIEADQEGNIYLDFINPYPHIIKYKLILEYE